MVLNKVDLLPAEGRDAAVARVAKRVSGALAATRFAGAPLLPVAARPGGGDGMAPGGTA